MSQQQSQASNEVQTEKDASIPEPVKMSTHLKAYRANYVRGVHNGDALAKALDGADIGIMEKVARKVLGKELAEEKIAKYSNLNPGQQRMNLGNMVRNRVKKNPELISKVHAVTGIPKDAE